MGLKGASMRPAVTNAARIRRDVASCLRALRSTYAGEIRVASVQVRCTQASNRAGSFNMTHGSHAKTLRHISLFHRACRRCHMSNYVHVIARFDGYLPRLLGLLMVLISKILSENLRTRMSGLPKKAVRIKRAEDRERTD